PKLRAAALEVLALEKDDFARQTLVNGLDDPGQAIVPVEKAVQLLANDDHGVAIPHARKILAGTFSNDAKEEALRVLSTDPNAGNLLAGILADQSQPTQLRSISAFSLREVDPKRFENVARGIVLNAQEDEAVRANCLGALLHLQGYSGRADPSVVDALSK